MSLRPAAALALMLLVPAVPSIEAGPAQTQLQTQPQTQPPPSRAAALALGELSKSLEALASKVSPCVVQIFVTGYAPPEEQQEGGTGEPAIERSSGSGVIVDPDGYIVTNAHVVENATRLEVELSSAASGVPVGRSIVKRRGRIVGARIVAIDHETDLAVVKVDASGLPTLAIGDSDRLHPGQIVLAFGSPLGLDSSVTMGVVSAVARQLEPDDPMIYIQTDAPINPGNSGGPLVDTDGHLVGINTLIYTQGGGSEGIGFAAPSNIVRNVFTQIRKTGRVLRGEIGVTAQTITPLLADALQLPSDAGIIISDVDPDGPADKAGVKPGDLVVALDGKPMENGRQLRVNLYSRAVGDTVSLELIRGGTRRTITVPVEEREDDPSRLEQLAAALRQIVSLAPLGVGVIDINDRVAKLLPDLREKSGAVIVAIAPDAPYSQQGKLKPGDVIRGINGKTIATVAYLLELTKELKSGTPVALQVERGGDYMYVAFRAK
jgi:serine protease Do